MRSRDLTSQLNAALSLWYNHRALSRPPTTTRFVCSLNRAYILQLYRAYILSRAPKRTPQNAKFEYNIFL